MSKVIGTTCVIVGGGPAGLMLGLILARMGVAVCVVEKHADFLRDFRGDTIHPSTQELLEQLGLLDEFLALPHADMQQVTLRWRDEDLVLADFRHLPTKRKAIAFMPQWDFLDLLARAGERGSAFTLIRDTQIDDLVFDGDRIVGVVGRGPDGPIEVRGDLVVAADGRDSTVRRSAGLRPVQLANAMDVLWFRLPKRPAESYPFVQGGAGMVITIDRGEFFQVAHVIPAGSWDHTEHALATMRDRVCRISASLGERVRDLSLEDIRLLHVRLERLRRWEMNGLLCIGDAAHAMSPAGGVGINLAIQDAVATARIVGPILRERRPTISELRRVQRRRRWPTLITQRVQQALQGTLLAVAPIPFALRVLRRFPVLTRITGRIVGLGVLQERLDDATLRRRERD